MQEIIQNSQLSIIAAIVRTLNAAIGSCFRRRSATISRYKARSTARSPRQSRRMPAGLSGRCHSTMWTRTASPPTSCGSCWHAISRIWTRVVKSPHRR